MPSAGTAFTTYYDPALKEENARDLPVVRLDLAEDPLELEGFDGVFHLAGQPGVASFGGVFPTYVRQQRAREPASVRGGRGGGIRLVFASSSSIYGDAASYPTPEDTFPDRSRRTGSRSSPCEHLAAAYATEFGLDVVTVRYFTIYGPRQRPDMAFTKMVSCLAEGRPFDLFGDGSQSRSFTYVDDAVEATISAMERAKGGSVFNVGGGAEVSMLEAIEVLGSITGRRLEIVRQPRRQGDASRTAADTSAHSRRARLGSRDVVRGRPRGSVALGRC